LGGLWFGAGVEQVMGVAGMSPQVFCVLGMGALFTAIVRAPLTGIILMIELTGTYGFMLPLLVSCLCAYGVAEAMGNTPIYEALRQRSMKTVIKAQENADKKKAAKMLAEETGGGTDGRG